MHAMPLGGLVYVCACAENVCHASTSAVGGNISKEDWAAAALSRFSMPEAGEGGSGGIGSGEVVFDGLR